MKLLTHILATIVVLMAWSCKKEETGPTSLCNPAISDSSALHPKATAYQAIIDEYTQKGLPGIILLIRDTNGLWIGTSGKADIEQDIPMQICTVSKVASITKMFVATATLMLVDEGLLDLDAKITQWLPASVTSKIENAEEASLRQLLTHSSGIYDVITDQGFYLELLNNPEKHWTQLDILEHVYGNPAVFPAGTDVEYSNTNTLLVSMIIEKVTGKPHHELIRERILNPLGLSDTYYFWHEALPSETAQGYFDMYNSGSILNLTNYNTGSGNGYGGIYSTVSDMKTFIEALFISKTLLSDAMLNEMQTFTVEDQGYDRQYGAGIFKDFLYRADDEFGLGHRGRDLAYSADVFWFPKNNTTMAMMVNYGTNGNSSLKQVFVDLRAAVADEIFAD